MLNEKVTVVICGKNYRLRTDNSRQLFAAAADVDMKISAYCDNDRNMRKEDAAVLAALDCYNDLNELKTKYAQLTSEVGTLTKSIEQANAAIEENKKLKEDVASLKNAKDELAKLTKRFSELEGKNEQLAETLKEANAKAAECNSLKKEADEAKKVSTELTKKNDQLSNAAKDSKKELDEMKKQLSEKDKRIAELSGEQNKVVSVGAENKRLIEKLEKAENFEEAFHREQKRAEDAEKERNALKSAKEQLDKTVAEYKTQIEQLSKEASGGKSAELGTLKEENNALNKLLAEQKAKLVEYENLAEANAQLNKTVTGLQNQLEAMQESGNSDEEKKLREELAAANSKNSELNKDFEELSTAY
ncbi:MAG: cell division protein ZapA, partial [Oscillospiraceae bacterium]|nr:cell division protein ZapA [Oscillospiraceae bacterium]